MSKPPAAICIALSSAAAASIVAVQTWHGPTVLTLSATHGIDTGDLLAAPLALLALAVARRHARRSSRGAARTSGGGSSPAPAVVVGVLLLLTGIVAWGGGGPLRPVGGGTFAGSIGEASSTSALRLDRWTAIALIYDGDKLRLYQNGLEVAEAPASGPINTTAAPLWIGGNQPYGEYFAGLIDDVRVYDRALALSEIEADARRTLVPAAGLVAGYAFDDDSGTTAYDASRHGNTGRVEGAEWVRGHHGRALRFDGVSAAVEVPASPSLDLREAMTLSAWVRPTESQRGWRTIVHRQTDAYFLTAGSTRQIRHGAIEEARIALLVAALLWFGWGVGTRHRPVAAARARTWWVPAVLFTFGSLADAVLAPTSTLVAPALVAAWLAATAPRRLESVAFEVAAVVVVALTIASLAGAEPVEEALSRNEGSVARSMAFGALFVLAGLAQTGAEFGRATPR